MEWFKKVEITPEEKEEIFAYIMSLLEKSFEEVDALAKTSWKHCKYVMKFYQIKPYTDLHKIFEESYLQPKEKLEQKALEWRLIGKMKENKELFIKEHLIDSYQYNEVKYQIINKKNLVYKNYTGEEDKVDTVLIIAIPYFSQQATRDKFWYSMEIYKSKTPEFFDKLISNMRTYEWNAVLTSNKK